MLSARNIIAFPTVLIILFMALACGEDQSPAGDAKSPLISELEANQTWPYEILGIFEESNSQDMDGADVYVWGEVVAGDAVVLVETRGSVLDEQGIQSGDQVIVSIRPGQKGSGVQIYEIVDIKKE